LSENSGEAQKPIHLGLTSPSLAPSGKRIGAALIDKLILFVAGTYLLSPLITTTHGLSPVSLIINTLAEFFYAGYFYSTHSATPGKMIFNLQVIKDSGAKLGFVEAGLRDSVGKFVSGLIFGIGYWMAFFRFDKHALHDLMFKTKVVSKN
jgi:uncharacterized RDD family membrane protein YckC